MTEPQADSLQEAIDWTPALGRRSAFLGWSLFALALLAFAATFVAAAVYLAVD